MGEAPDQPAGFRTLQSTVVPTLHTLRQVYTDLYDCSQVYTIVQNSTYLYTLLQYCTCLYTPLPDSTQGEQGTAEHGTNTVLKQTN